MLLVNEITRRLGEDSLPDSIFVLRVYARARDVPQLLLVYH